MREFFWRHDVGIKEFLFTAILLLAANLLFLNRAILSRAKEEVLAPAPQPAVATCDAVCQKLITEEVARATATFSATVAPAPQPATPAPSAPVTSYISLGNGGSTKKQDWTRLDGSEVQFNLADYPQQPKVFWEGNLKIFSGNSRCFARLFDKTNIRSVDFSEQSTERLEFEYLRTQQLVIWTGNNKYQLEIKSLNGIECFVDSPRLVIKY